MGADVPPLPCEVWRGVDSEGTTIALAGNLSDPMSLRQFWLGKRTGQWQEMLAGRRVLAHAVADLMRDRA
jgi:hypothetical protein